MFKSFGPFSKIGEFLETTGFLGVMGLGLTILFFIIIIVSRQRRIAIYMLLIAMVLSLLGEPLHSMFDLVRWSMVFMLIPLGFAGVFHLGPMYFLFCVNAMLSMFFIPGSRDLLWSVQMFSLHFAVLIGYAGSVTYVIQTPTDLLRIFRFFGGLGLILGIINIVMYAVGYGSEAVRFSGIGVSPGQLSLVFSILGCFCIWLGVQGRNNTVRGFWIAVSGLLAISIILSTQRTGALLMAVAMMYYLFRKPNKQTLRRIGFFLGLATIVFIGLIVILPERREYIFIRFTGQGSGLGATSGRIDIWRSGLSLCLDQPIIGHGAGSDMIEAMIQMGHSFHNAYLSIWYNSGIFGLVAMLTALFGTFWQASRLSKRFPDETTGDAMRLLAGLVLGIIASGFFERTLAGSANLLVAIVLFTMVATRTLKQYEHPGLFADDLGGYYDNEYDLFMYQESYFNDDSTATPGTEIHEYE